MLVASLFKSVYSFIRFKLVLYAYTASYRKAELIQVELSKPVFIQVDLSQRLYNRAFYANLFMIGFLRVDILQTDLHQADLPKAKFF